MTKQNKNTWLFIGFLLLAGLANMTGRMFSHVWDSLMSCFLYVIYTGLLIFWLGSVRVRLLPSRARTYMFAAAGFMLLYIFLRLFKYRFALIAQARRYVAYAYWIPQTMMATLYLLICIQIRRGIGLKAGAGALRSSRGKRLGRRFPIKKWNEALLLIPAAALSLMAITNDLHTLVYVPKIPLAQFDVTSGTYGYHIGFYLLNVWIILTVLAGIILLFREAGRMPRKAILLFAGDIMLWYGILLLDILVLDHSNILIFNTPETNIFGMLGIFEISIRERLIPYNENYAGFFSHLNIPVMVTDRNFDPAYVSGAKLPVEKDVLQEALRTPVYPSPDQKLSGKEIQGGYAFWVEDEAQVHKAQERLMEANEMIGQENTLIEAEARQKEENAHITARHRIYHEIAEEMYPVQKRIGELLGRADPGSADYRDRIAEVSVLNAYVKRKTDLLLLASENVFLDSHDLYLAMKESGGYLAYLDLHVSVEKPPQTSFRANEMIRLYDTFEQIAEQLVGRTDALMVSFHENGLRLAAQADIRHDIVESALPIRFLENDEILYMDVIAAEGGVSI